MCGIVGLLLKTCLAQSLGELMVPMIGMSERDLTQQDWLFSETWHSHRVQSLLWEEGTLTGQDWLRTFKFISVTPDIAHMAISSVDF